MVATAESLGPAERIINALLASSDHCHHGRLGILEPNAGSVTGYDWHPARLVKEGEQHIVQKATKLGKKDIYTRIGVLLADKTIEGAPRGVRWQPAGLFKEAVVWMYKQIVEVWKLDNEFAAKWASYMFTQEKHRDFKAILAAFMLVQSRAGKPELVEGKVAFHDADFRAVGEAMLLLQSKDFNPKMIGRVHDILTLPEIAAINRELGFGRSLRNPALGRWTAAVKKYLTHFEENPKLLKKAVDGGFKTHIVWLAKTVGYKPENPKFFQLLRWKQVQAGDGRRTLAIGEAVAAAETWDGLTEEQICALIMKGKKSFKVIESLVPSSIGITRAIMVAAMEAGALSDKDIVIKAVTIEDLGLLQIQAIKERVATALKNAEDMRASNIARNAKTEDLKEMLQAGAEAAAQKVVGEAMQNGLRVYFFIDRSSSMQGAIERAKGIIIRMIPCFPLDKIHICHFNTVGMEVRIPHASAQGVEAAFRGVQAAGGTSYGAGVLALQHHKPAANEDAFFIFVGDEEDCNPSFADAVRRSGLSPVAFGLVKIGGRGHAVSQTAAELGIPCMPIDEKMFEDVYAAPRMLRNLITSTPVGFAPARAVPVKRVSLIDIISSTPLLAKPLWAA